MKPRYAGVCGSDVATVTFKASPLLSALTASPCVLGRELVGTVTEAGARATVKVATGWR